MLRRSARERLLPLLLLLVGALLLCHGAFGPLHQLSNAALSKHLMVGHPSHQQGLADGHPVGAPDYAAALFALLLGMVYGLLSREARVRDALSALRRTGWLPTTVVFQLPRGPDPPLFLQVFRL